MQRFILSRQGLSILTANFTFLNRPFATDYNLRAGVLFHGLQSVTTGSDQKPNEVDIWVLLLRDKNLVADANYRWFVIRRWFEVRIHALHALDKLMALFF